MIWLFLVIIIVNRLAVLVIAADDAWEESFNLWKDNLYKLNLIGIAKELAIKSIAKKQKRNQHFYFSIDRAAVYILLMIIMIFGIYHLQPWQITILVAMDLGINLGWFKFWHDGLGKLFYNNLDPTVYPERFFANSDNQSDASTDKWFLDIFIWRIFYVSLCVSFTIIQIILYISWV